MVAKTDLNPQGVVSVRSPVIGPTLLRVSLLPIQNMAAITRQVRSWKAISLASTMELHLAWDAESVAIAGEQVPLENEPTAALALTFTGVPIMILETFGFLGRLTGFLKDRPPLVSTTPFRPGLIPVVLRHGKSHVVLSLPAKVADKIHVLFPGLTSDALGLANRLLPGTKNHEHGVEGQHSRPVVSVPWLGARSDRVAAQRNQTN